MRQIIVALALTVVMGCVTTAIDQYDALNCAYMAGDVSTEYYDKETTRLAPAVIRESAYSTSRSTSDLFSCDCYPWWEMGMGRGRWGWGR